MKPWLQAVLFDLDNTLIDRDGAWRAAVREAFGEPLPAEDPWGQDERVDRLAAWLRPDPSLQAALGELGGRVRLGLVSNGGGRSQRRKLAAAGLEHSFHRVLISGEVGCEKPDPAIFRRACRELGVAPERCLHVGDRPREDGDGARSAGIRAVLVGAPLTGPALRALAARWLA